MTFSPIEEYMLKSRQERREHLELTQSCIEIGGHASTVFKGLLAHHLKTTIPKGMVALLCHACNNPKCSNPAHLYWGTAKDNYLDMVENGTDVFRQHAWKNHRGGKAAWAAKLGSTYGGTNAITPQQLEEIRAVIEGIPKKWGWKQKASNLLNVSHTQVNRYLRMLK